MLCGFDTTNNRFARNRKAVFAQSFGKSNRRRCVCDLVPSAQTDRDLFISVRQAAPNEPRLDGDALALTNNYVESFRSLRRNNRRHARSNDRGFLGRDLSQTVSQIFLM